MKGTVRPVSHELHTISPNDLRNPDLIAARDVAYDRYDVQTDQDDAPIAAHVVMLNGANGEIVPDSGEVLIVDDVAMIAWFGEVNTVDYRDGRLGEIIADWIEGLDD